MNWWNKIDVKINKDPRNIDLDDIELYIACLRSGRSERTLSTYYSGIKWYCRNFPVIKIKEFKKMIKGSGNIDIDLPLANKTEYNNMFD